MEFIRIRIQSLSNPDRILVESGSNPCQIIIQSLSHPDSIYLRIWIQLFSNPDPILEINPNPDTSLENNLDPDPDPTRTPGSGSVTLQSACKCVKNPISCSSNFCDRSCWSSFSALFSIVTASDVFSTTFRLSIFSSSSASSCSSLRRSDS